jgi:Protein of unknown function (DUF2569)
VNDSQPPEIVEHQPAGAPQQEASPAPIALPIGGWLWLPAIGLVIGILSALLDTVKGFGSLLERERLAVAASVPGLPHSPRSLSLLFVAIAHLLLFVALLWIGSRFARRKRNAQYLLVAVYVLDLVTLGGFYISGRGHLMAPRERIGALLGSAIWVPYFMLSDRVKRTFLL